MTDVRQGTVRMRHRAGLGCIVHLEEGRAADVKEELSG